jgi:hypothetical protein
MKAHVTLLMLPVLFVFGACDQLTGKETRPPAELIVGKWRFEKLGIPKEKLADLEDWDRASFEEKQHEMKIMRYSFFNDGTYAMGVEFGDDFAKDMERGTFKLINDGTVLLTEPIAGDNKNAKASELAIMSLTKDSLIIGLKTDKASMIFLRSN